MSEQQEHLKNLLAQRDSILSEIQNLNAQIAAKRELALRASGAIEYLQQIGVKLEETPETSEASEAPPVPEGETVNSDEELPPPVTDSTPASVE